MFIVGLRNSFFLYHSGQGCFSEESPGNESIDPMRSVRSRSRKAQKGAKLPLWEEYLQKVFICCKGAKVLDFSTPLHLLQVGRFICEEKLKNSFLQMCWISTCLNCQSNILILLKKKNNFFSYTLLSLSGRKAPVTILMPLQEQKIILHCVEIE